MKLKIGYVFEYIKMFILLGFLWPKGEIKNREEDLARLYKAKDQVEINDENKIKIKIKHNNKSSDDKHYDRDSAKSFI